MSKSEKVYFSHYPFLYLRLTSCNSYSNISNNWTIILILFVLSIQQKSYQVTTCCRLGKLSAWYHQVRFILFCPQNPTTWKSARYTFFPPRRIRRPSIPLHYPETNILHLYIDCKIIRMYVLIFILHIFYLSFTLFFLSYDIIITLILIKTDNF